MTQAAQIEWLRKEVICLKNNKPCGCSEQSGECTCTVNIEGQVTVNSNVAVENTVKLTEPKLITTPINYLVNGKCANATLVTSIENNNVTASYFLIKGAKQDLSTIPVYQEGICCCAPTSNATPTSSGTGAIGAIEPVWTFRSSAYRQQDLGESSCFYFIRWGYSRNATKFKLYFETVKIPTNVSYKITFYDTNDVQRGEYISGVQINNNDVFGTQFELINLFPVQPNTLFAKVKVEIFPFTDGLNSCQGGFLILLLLL